MRLNFTRTVHDDRLNARRLVIHQRIQKPCQIHAGSGNAGRMPFSVPNNHVDPDPNLIEYGVIVDIEGIVPVFLEGIEEPAIRRIRWYQHIFYRFGIFDTDQIIIATG